MSSQRAAGVHPPGSPVITADLDAAGDPQLPDKFCSDASERMLLHAPLEVLPRTLHELGGVVVVHNVGLSL